MSIYIFQKTYDVKYHLILLVRIVDQLGDQPFNINHRRLSFAFNIFVFYNFGRCSSASHNCSPTCLLLLLINDLIFSIKDLLTLYWL